MVLSPLLITFRCPMGVEETVVVAFTLIPSRIAFILIDNTSSLTGNLVRTSTPSSKINAWLQLEIEPSVLPGNISVLFPS